MAITFDSIQDPYGIRQAGSALGQALMQRGLQDRQEQAQMSQEQRALAQQQAAGSALASSLQQFRPQEGEQWDEQRITDFMSQAIAQGASFNDVINSVKAFQSGQQKQSAQLNTPFSREMAKSNVGLLKSYGESGRKAKEMLGTWGELDAAINDPKRSTNAVARGLKMTPAASAFYSPSDQVISSYSKEIISNFTNMKGLRLTDAKLRWLEGIAPAPWKTTEANQEASAYFKRMAQIQDAYGEIATNMANAYAEAGLEPPSNFERLVDQAVEPLRQEIDALYMNRNKNADNVAGSGSIYKSLNEIKGKDGMQVTDQETGKKYVFKKGKWSVTK